MPFSSYKSIGAVAKKFQIKYVLKDYIMGIGLPVQEGFKEELDLLFTDGVVDNSSDAICENLIYPVLKEVGANQREVMTKFPGSPVLKQVGASTGEQGEQL